ncbi:unnamed protein product [Psylliodes chrysocephalus]|uniref:Cerebellar degeneration-related protein 2-like n=1 Tax=Psylliodes chrysocephalus TaxID=3402493 RepID=A0A9P0GJ71_9CUCU|nr:unnamed protein product [Psylliodes chrysocephala]
MMNNEPDSPPANTNSLSSLDFWDYSIELECLEGNQDLQLAAELGKTLLERNKELETTLKQHQNVIDDQAQEIEYLTKQTVALREVNDSRFRIYEQLEVSIHDLERANHRLVLENAAEKKIIKNLNVTIDGLETKVEELQSTIDDLTMQLDLLKRKSQRTFEVSTPSNYKELVVSPDSSAIIDEECNVKRIELQYPSSTEPKSSSESKADVTPQTIDELDAEGDMEQVTQLLSQLSKMRSQCTRDERRITELEEQLSTLVQQNQSLENQVIQLSHKGDDLNMKSMHEELTSLEEVRQGLMCSRCLRSVVQNDDEIPEHDDSSILDDPMELQFHSSFSMDVQDNRLEEILRKDLSILWISPTMNLVTLLFDLCLYLKDSYLVPLLSKPLKIPFILFHYCLKHKLQ